MKHCRFCKNTGLHEFINLGHMPPSNSFLTKEQLLEPEVTYPLKLFVCDKCWLVQTDEYKKAVEIFSDEYIYYSSYSPSWVQHAKEYVDMAVRRFGYNSDSVIIEIGGNDGYLLQHFHKHNIRNLTNIEPAKGPATEAMRRNISTRTDLFSKQYADLLPLADLICGINVLAHQPDINDFVEGLRIALKPDGIVTMEFPHLMRLVDECQFDTIYHEHYSYFSFMTVCGIFQAHGLEIFDVEQLPTHGGSLRIFATHVENRNHWLHFDCLERMGTIRSREDKMNLDYFKGFQGKVGRIKRDLVQFLMRPELNSDLGDFPVIVGYGAAAKGNTLLNYCGIRSDLLQFVVDRSPHKQGKYLPGSHIPVYDEDYLKKVQPDYVLILPWNLKEEIMEQLKYIREWDGKFVIPIPQLEIL